MAEGRPGFRRDAGVDGSGNKQIVQLRALRRNFELEPRRRLPLADFFPPVGYPSNRFQIDTILVFQDAAHPERRRRKPRLQSDSLAVKILWTVDTRALVN